MMPKGRGSNERRQSGRQHRPKDKSESIGKGFIKLQILYDPKEIEKRRKARKKARRGSKGNPTT